MSDEVGPVVLSCPGSKSMTQRALMIAALAREPVEIEGALICDDSRYLSDVLRRLGASVSWAGERVEVLPAPLRCPDETLFVGNAGTAMRFAACLALVCEGELRLDGDARMRQRPIGSLVEGLHALGVDGRFLGTPGYPPVALQRGDRLRDEVELDISLSSQYASGLLLVAPCLPEGLQLRLGGQKVSLPYLQMTTQMMRRAGAQVDWNGDREVVVAPSVYRARRIAVEADWSTAAFLLGAAEIAGRNVELPGLVAPDQSLQGDAVFVALLDELRAPGAVQVDLRDAPDLIAPLAAVALFATHVTTIRGVQHARIKECDRIAVLNSEFSKLGASIREYADGLEIAPLDLAKVPQGPIELDPANDHRMAMAFGLASLRVPNLVVRDPECVSKSFPDFWRQLACLRGESTGKEVG